MLDFRRFEHVFLCSLLIVAALVGVARLVVHLTQPEVQLTLAAASNAADHSKPDHAETDFVGPKGSPLTALTPLPISRFAVMPFYVSSGWDRLVNGAFPHQNDEAEKRTVQASSNQTGAITPDGRVDINRATAEELQMLPGIGPALAERILEMRERRGGFVYPEELLDVSGIGRARYERLIDHIIIGPTEE